MMIVWVIFVLSLPGAPGAKVFHELCAKEGKGAVIEVRVGATELPSGMIHQDIGYFCYAPKKPSA